MLDTAAGTPAEVTDLRVHEVRDLGAAATLAGVVERRRAADAAEAELLSFVVHWADLHPVVDPAEQPAASWVPDRDLTGSAPAPLAGEGTPQVTEACVVELAAALDISFHSGLQLVGDALELCFRLPRLWDLVQRGVLQSWRARAVAVETVALPRAAAAFVDRHLAVLARNGDLPRPRIRPLVHEALLRHDPDAAAGIEEKALARRGVWFDHRESTATTRLTATLDTPDALGLEQAVAELATTIGRLGDRRALDVRRATALGMLSDPQRTLALTSGAGAPESPDAAGVTLYLHVDARDLERGIGGGVVERLGPATLGLLQSWLTRVGAVRVRPVLDMGRRDPVDRHDPPEWMRELVVLRDGRCVFPGCHTGARSCDLDHVTPYDEHGPPDQTRPDNLACLCRRHHRTKTHGGWSYHRTRDGGYEWTSPLGRTYLTRPG